jgi:acyl-CoA thioester hydrolase
VTYQLGIFKRGESTSVAEGRFVHVYVDARTRQSTAIPDIIRQAVSPLLLEKP